MITGRPLKFKTEKEYCDYIEANIVKFCDDVLGSKYISHKREHTINHRKFGGNRPRIDFEIITSDGIYFVECKNPNQVFHETTRAISQLLSYATLAEPRKVRLVLVCSDILDITQQIILKYELPILVALVNKDVVATWSKEFEDQVNSGEIQVEGQYAIPKY